ncbi:MAG TPA: hypothetical protein VHY91_21340 [Pirellulales bacterium]|jgi:hypothetical protein|nr:hypothetical protein [Pirellulales bacterium]
MNLRLESTFAWRNLLCVAVGLFWLGAIGAGLSALAWYDNSPAAPQQPVDEWPSESTIHRSEHAATLVLFAHPRCPCTRASLGELEKIVAHCQPAITPWVVFFKPEGAPDGWEKTDLWSAASAIPGVHVVCDPGGEEARRFHAAASGQTLLYSARGELLFTGGITFARGHAGDNAGGAAIESYCLGNSPGYRQTPVFGCPIIATAKQD